MERLARSAFCLGTVLLFWSIMTDSPGSVTFILGVACIGLPVLLQTAEVVMEEEMDEQEEETIVLYADDQPYLTLRTGMVTPNEARALGYASSQERRMDALNDAISAEKVENMGYKPRSDGTVIYERHEHEFKNEDVIEVESYVDPSKVLAYLCPKCLERVKSYSFPRVGHIGEPPIKFWTDDKESWSSDESPADRHILDEEYR